MKVRNLAFKLSFVCVAFSFFSFLSTAAHANSTLYALLQKGVTLVVTHDDGDAYTVKFTSDGRYVTSQGAKGAWAIKGGLFCTTRDSNSNFRGRAGKKDCGELPEGKTLGDVWVMRSNRGGNVTVSIAKPRAK